jgi:hypothetical protein
VKGSPRSIMLSWANAVMGWWTSAAVAAIQRQQRAMIKAAQSATKPGRKARDRKKRRQV